MWFVGNSSSRILKNDRPTLVATFLLNGGLYQMTLRGQFFLEDDGRADWMKRKACDCTQKCEGRFDRGVLLARKILYRKISRKDAG